MNQQAKQVLKFLLFLALGVGLLYFAFVNLELDYDKVINGFKSADYFWISVAVVSSLVSHWLRAIRWNLMLEPLGKKPSSLNAFNAVMIGYLFNFAIPRMGEVSRCGVLNRTDKIPISQSLATVVVERVFDMLILLLLTAVVLLLQFETLYGFFNETFFAPIQENLQGGALLILSALFVIAALALYVFIKFKDAILNHPLLAKVRGFIQGLIDGFKSVFQLKQPLLFFAYTIAIWILYFCNTAFYLMAFTETAHISTAAMLSILVIGTFGFAAPVSGGIGAYHIFVAKGLALYGVSSVAGGVFGFVSHGVQMIMILVVGSVSLILTLIEEKKRV